LQAATNRIRAEAGNPTFFREQSLHSQLLSSKQETVIRGGRTPHYFRVQLGLQPLLQPPLLKAATTAVNPEGGPVNDYLTVSEAARQIPGARPKDISDLLYLRRLDVGRCPLFAGRRMIPVNYLDEVAAALRQAGRLPEPAATGGAGHV
jgi:hypothetical protein